MTQTYIKTLTPKYALAGTTGSNDANVGILFETSKNLTGKIEKLIKNGL